MGLDSLDHRRVASIERVTRPASARIAACVATGLLAAAVAHLAGPAAAAADDSTPLEVSIDSMSPAAIPATGDITVTGQITNQSDDTWTELNVYLLTSPGPFSTSEALLEAQQTDPASEIGDRLTAEELYDSVGDLAPGSSVSYTLSVARKDLDVTGEPGVYWLGVHVLGASEEGRIEGADGRARTFAPLMDRDGPRATMSMVMPLKAGVRREPDGRLRNVRTWEELLSPEGRLGRLMQLSGTSVDFPLTWVLDPAVIDAASSVGAGNPPISIAPNDEGGEPDSGVPDESPGSSPSTGTTDDPSEDSSDDTDGDSADSADSAESADGDTPAPSEEAEQAAAWLDTFRRQSEQDTVLTVPYGDLDAASVLRNDFVDLYAQATELSSLATGSLGITSSPIVAPATGFLPKEVLPKLDPETPVLLSEAALPDAPGSVVETERAQRIVLDNSSVEQGGPTPTPPYRALALRQRILSEAALHALSSDNDQPLVVSTPQLWDPGSDWRLAEFFSGFDAPWLRTVNLPTASIAGSSPVPSADEYDVELRYPRAEARAELSIANLLATEELDQTGEIFANLLTRNDSVDEALSKSAMLASTYRSRDHQNASVVMARGTTARVRSLMERVRVEAPSFVTMSSEEGPFAITVVNDLDQPVTVGVSAETGTAELVIPSPDPVSLGPGQRASVRLQATSKDIGLHSVSLVPTNSNGQPLGNATTFNVRSSQIGLVIWAIMGLGAAVLFLASGVRIVRRIRSRQSTHGPVPQSATE